MSIFKGGVSPTTIYAWEDGQKVISRVYVWAGGTQHTVWDQSLDASVGPPKASATALARPPGVTSSPPAVVVPGPAVTSSTLARPPVVTASSSVLSPPALSSTAGISPIVSADAMVGIEVATAGADALATVNDVLLLPPVASAAAAGHVPGVDFGGNAFVTSPKASATAAGIVPVVSSNMAMTVPIVSASGQGIVPSPNNATPIPVASATATGIVPGISMGVPAVVATATAAGIVPAVTASSLILPPAASATATGIVPQVISSINASVTVPAAAGTTSALARPPFVIVDYTDDFNRANASTLGADWDQGNTSGGINIGITSNHSSWGNGSGTDGVAWALHKGSLFTDAFYVKVTVSTADGSGDSRLLGGANTGLTVFGYLNWFSNKIFFGKSTGSYTGITDLASVTTGITIGAGTVIEFYRTLVSGHYTYIVTVAGVQKISFADTSDQIAISSSNRRVGFGQEHDFPGVTSGFINDWQGKDSLL